MSTDDIKAYVKAKQCIEDITKQGAKRKREANSRVKELRGNLDEHIPSNIKYTIPNVTSDEGQLDLVAFRKVRVSQKRLTSEAVLGAWDAISPDALKSALHQGDSMTEATLDVLEDELKQRLAKCTEYTEVVPRGSKQEPPEMESVHIDSASPEVRDLAVRLWYAKKEAADGSSEISLMCKPFRDEIKRLEPVVKSALGDIPGASSMVDESARPVYVRRKTQWVKPKINFRGEVGPIVEEALLAAADGELPNSSCLVGMEIIDRRKIECRVALDEAS